MPLAAEPKPNSWKAESDRPREPAGRAGKNCCPSASVILARAISAWCVRVPVMWLRRVWQDEPASMPNTHEAGASSKALAESRTLPSAA